MDTSILDKKLLRERFTGIDRAALAFAIGSSRNTIDQVATGHILTSPKRAREIEAATNGQVSARDLRPDIFI